LLADKLNVLVGAGFAFPQ